MAAESGLTHDAFLGGRVRAWQPLSGYRAATDPVLLAAACPARPGQSVLEPGCGVGVAALCLVARVENLSITGLERQAEYAGLARRNVAEAGAPITVLSGDLAAPPPELRAQSFDHVIANPPFFRPAAGTKAPDAGRAMSRHEETPLHAWIDCARRRLKDRGWVTLILTAERSPEALGLLADGFGAIALKPLTSRRGRPAGRVLIQAQKGGRGPFRLLPPLILHDGDSHTADGDDYSATATAILRQGATLDWA